MKEKLAFKEALNLTTRPLRLASREFLENLKNLEIKTVAYTGLFLMEGVGLVSIGVGVERGSFPALVASLSTVSVVSGVHIYLRQAFRAMDRENKDLLNSAKETIRGHKEKSSSAADVAVEASYKVISTVRQ